MNWLVQWIQDFFNQLWRFFREAFSGAGHDVTRTIVVDSLSRTYVVHLPRTYDGESNVPLVIVLHGGGANAQNAIHMTRMNEKSDQEGFMAVYPEGTSRAGEGLFTWNAGEGYCCGFAEENQIDDVQFIRTMIRQLADEFRVDMRRIFITGFSNGGMMSYRLGCELSDTIAAIAPVAGALGVNPCQPVRPLPVIIFHGTADLHVRYEGGSPLEHAPGEEDRIDPPVADAVSFWVEHNQCSKNPTREESDHVLREMYGEGQGGAEVLLYTVQGGGHAWPGGRKGSPAGDEPTEEISATNQIWSFFVRHPRTLE